jgi:uncharacterized protein HemX
VIGSVRAADSSSRGRVELYSGANMTPETAENIDDPGATPSAVAAIPGASARKDALRAGTVVPVALGLVLGITYLGYANVQRQIKTQHAELQSLKDKMQEMAAAQSRIDVDRSQPSISEIPGLQNHTDNLRGRSKKLNK